MLVNIECVKVTVTVVILKFSGPIVFRILALYC